MDFVIREKNPGPKVEIQVNNTPVLGGDVPEKPILEEPTPTE